MTILESKIKEWCVFRFRKNHGNFMTRGKLGAASRLQPDMTYRLRPKNYSLTYWLRPKNFNVTYRLRPNECINFLLQASILCFENNNKKRMTRVAPVSKNVHHFKTEFLPSFIFVVYYNVSGFYYCIFHLFVQTGRRNRQIISLTWCIKMHV